MLARLAKPVHRVPGGVFEQYQRDRALLRPVGICVTNTGTVLVEDARLVLHVPKTDALSVRDRAPVEPTHYLDEVLRAFPFGGNVKLRECDGHWEFSCRLGKIQPSASEWSAPLWIGSTEPLVTTVTTTILGDNIAKPIDTKLELTIGVELGWLDLPDS